MILDYLVTKKGLHTCQHTHKEINCPIPCTDIPSPLGPIDIKSPYFKKHVLNIRIKYAYGQ